MGRAGRIALAGLVVCGGFIAAAVVSDQLLISALTRRIEAKTGLHAEIGSVKLSVWPSLRVTASNISLTDTADPTHAPVLTAPEVRFRVPAQTLLGDVRLEDVELTKPVIHLVRRSSASGRAEMPGSGKPATVGLDHLTITDATFTYQDPVRHAQVEIDHLDLRATAPDPAGPLDVDASARLMGRDLRVHARAASMRDLLAGQETRLEATIAADGLPASGLKLQTVAAAFGTVLHFDHIRGQLGGGSIEASGAFDWGAEPPSLAALVSAEHVTLPAPSAAATGGGGALDRRRLDPRSVRLLDAAVSVNVTDLKIGPVQIGAAHAKAALTDGALRADLFDCTLYGGNVQGTLTVDDTKGELHESVKATVSHLDMSPLLVDLANTHTLTGRVDLSLDATSTGTTDAEIAGHLAGSATLSFGPGRVTGIDVPGYVRAVVAYLPPAWGQATNAVDVQSLSGSFSIADGVAQTQNLRIVSPILDVTGKGRIDLAHQNFDLRFDPRVAAAGQGRAPGAAPLGLGAAVLVRGPWHDPQMSADLSGLMRNPQPALDTLQNLGQQILGGGGKGGNVDSGAILKGLGDLLGGMGRGQ